MRKVNELKAGSILSYVNLAIGCVIPLLYTPVMLDTALSHGDLVPLEEGSLTQEELRLLDEEAFCHLVRCFGSRRILFGSDSPWSDQAISKDWILQTKLTEEEKENILGRNAAAMLGLEI